jgi:hypothetical protein
MADDVVLTIWTIYFNPKDFPGRWVTRNFLIVRGTPAPVAGNNIFLSDSLQAARSVIPDDMTCLGRQDEDEPQIVESWI